MTSREKCSLVKRVDIYGVHLPSFNLKGKERVKTASGGVMTVIILAITLLFAGIKMEQLVTRKNPDVTKNIIEDFHDTDEKVLLMDENGQGGTNFKMAFSF